jgi:DNA-binding GntR family transcriptional regulator
MKMTIKVSSKFKKIYNIIIEEIVTGKLFPGQRLIERELIEKYGKFYCYENACNKRYTNFQ